MIPIVGLCGVARSGKDSFFRYAQTYLKEKYNKEAVTDVRYENEYEMIKKKGGICVHLKRIDAQGNLVKYANIEEERNDPIVESRADVNINWGTYGDNASFYLAHISSFIDSYFNEN
jgi:hypothetical protein